MWLTIKTRISDYLGIEDVDAGNLHNHGLGWDSGVFKLVLCEGEVQDWIVLGSVDV